MTFSCRLSCWRAVESNLVRSWRAHNLMPVALTAATNVRRPDVDGRRRSSAPWRRLRDPLHRTCWNWNAASGCGCVDRQRWRINRYAERAMNLGARCRTSL